MHILIVKMSSLGDVIHTLPALTDAQEAIADLQADWVVEEALAEIPSWHRAVDQVIPIAIRRWRKDWRKAWHQGQIGLFRRQLKSRRYDLIIDAQGLLKSAWVTSMAQGPVAGLSWQSAREPASSLFYRHRCWVPRSEHAVQRVRQLFAQALDYSFDASLIDYGISRQVGGAETPYDQKPLLTFLHGTTWESKHWPELYWRKLAELAVEAGFRIQLPWGTDAEQERALRIAEGLQDVHVLERLNLGGLADKLSASAGVVAVDTGLGHLSAALNRPTVSIYGATNPSLSGTFGYHQLQLKSDLACSPCLRRHCRYQGQALGDQTTAGQSFVVEPACYRAAPPEQVFMHLQRMMQEAH